jgi:hypothetical protein
MLILQVSRKLREIVLVIVLPFGRGSSRKDKARVLDIHVRMMREDEEWCERASRGTPVTRHTKGGQDSKSQWKGTTKSGQHSADFAKSVERHLFFVLGSSWVSA